MEYTFDAIGTTWSITTDTQDVSLQQIRERIDIYDRNYSRFRSDSLITKMSRVPGTYILPDDAQPLFDLQRELYTLTNGAFTPLIGNSLAAAGYDATYSLTPRAVIPATPLWEDALEYHFPTLTVKQPVLIDVGAAGKGHLVDIIATMLGSNEYIINAGGDIRTDGVPQRIALEDPDDTARAIGIATIQNESLCGSAGNRRTWNRYHHILDPRTLTSPHTISAVWVTAQNTILADALSTCLFLVPLEMLVPHYKFEYLILYPDRSVQMSAHFPAQLFT